MGFFCSLNDCFGKEEMEVKVEIENSHSRI
jgi:hypothetical protein